MNHPNKRTLRLITIFITLTLMTACTSVIPETNTYTQTEKDVLRLVNNVRQTGYDCRSKGTYPATTPLTLNALLTTSAQKHAQDMNLTNTMSHTTPKGAKNYPANSSFADRVSAEGYKYALLGENVAFNYASAEDVMDAWLASDGHCANIMNAGFTELGVGHDGVYWAQTFARPQ